MFLNFTGAWWMLESRPVKGATVKLSRDGRSVAAVTSKADGTFSHPEESRWVAYYGGADPAVQVFTVGAAMGSSRVPRDEDLLGFSDMVGGV